MVKYLRLAGIAFVVFYLLSQPGEAADKVNMVIDGLTGGANSLSIFVNGIG